MSGAGNQFSYDANGNLIQDALNNNNEMLYDHRNLITELKHRSMIIGDTIYLTKYYYDEGGNRIRKMTYAYLGSLEESVPPANSDVSNTSDWSIRNDEVYSRDVSGREVAIYKNASILEYPFYGLDMIGKLKNDELHFYLKDHLGSVRAVVQDDKILSSQDYDAWGYILEGRTYQSEEGKFKFTGKERDEESFYDYFGARYYDARVGRWGQVEPLLDEYPQISPFIYSLNNPIRILDDDGNWPKDGFEFHVTTAEDIISSFNEIVERVSLGYEKLFSGNIKGAYEQMKSNIIESPRLFGGLIPGDFTTDFILPLGMVKGSGKMLKLTEGLSIEKQAKEIHKFIGKNSVTMPEGILDLVGRPHNFIKTPHFKPLIIQQHKGKFFTKSLQRHTRSATQQDLNNAVDFVNKIIKADIQLKIQSKF